MKKIRLLIFVLGLVSIFGLSQKVQAETTVETLPDFTPSSALQKATADVRTVTLEHGETYRMQKKAFIIYPHTLIAKMRISTADRKLEIFKYNLGEIRDGKFTIDSDSNPLFNNNVFLGYSYGFSRNSPYDRPIDLGCEITNYSAGAVTYKIGMNIGYAGFEDPLTLPPFFDDEIRDPDAPRPPRP